VTEEKPIELITPWIVTDEPVDKRRDERAYFQFEEYARTFARIIAARRTRTPLTIGIHGGWGTGKTTLMRAIEEQLCGWRRKGLERPLFLNPGEINIGEGESLYRPCRTVWFNAWKYSRQEALLVALIETILSQMRRDGFIHELYAELARPDQPKMKIAEAVISTLSQVFTLGQVEIDLTKFQTESRFKTHMAFLDEFQEVFDRLLRWYVVRDWKDEREVDDQKGVLVIFVDDLDRCLPDKTVQVLETIKLMLGKRGTIFVLGASRSVVQAAVKAHYKLQKFEDVDPQDYLDKIVQLRFDLPPVRRGDMEKFISESPEWEWEKDDPLKVNLPLVTEGVPTNPRRVKTFINYLELHWGLLVNSRQVDPADREQFVVWMVLTDVAPQLAKHLREMRTDEERAACLNQLIGRGDKEKGGLRLLEAEEPLRPLMGNIRLQRVLENLRQRKEGFVFDADKLGRFIHLSAPPVQAPPEEPEEEAVAEEVAPAPGEARRRRLGDEKARLRAEDMLPKDPKALLAVIDDPEASLAYRIAAGEELARLGDPRFSGDYLLPGFVDIPAGEFWMGSDQISGDEKPVHRVQVGAFAIAHYPVTNAQYGLFVQAAGRKPPRHWEGGQMPLHLANHPVVNVTWRDAVAYCRWLSQETGQEYRLPTEAEWERAARGGLPSPSEGEGVGVRVWPWGDEWDPEKCNTSEGGPGTTTPVGIYPAGASPEGVLDMAGNVWEWCSSLYKPYPYDPSDGRENLEAGALRVVRGGSFDNDRDFARCASRYWRLPDFAWNHYGFRVVVSPISPASAL